MLMWKRRNLAMDGQNTFPPRTVQPFIFESEYTMPMSWKSHFQYDAIIADDKNVDIEKPPAPARDLKGCPTQPQFTLRLSLTPTRLILKRAATIARRVVWGQRELTCGTSSCTWWAPDWRPGRVGRCRCWAGAAFGSRAPRAAAAAVPSFSWRSASSPSCLSSIRWHFVHKKRSKTEYSFQFAPGNYACNYTVHWTTKCTAK